jgi:hypothetical protein
VQIDEEEEDKTVYKVVAKHEEQYSIRLALCLPTRRSRGVFSRTERSLSLSRIVVVPDSE